MAAKLGYEAIKYVFTKALTKKGSQGIARIPGKAYDMRMKQLVDEMALKMKALGYDINNVTQKEVQGLLDSAEALQKQKTKAFTSQLMKDMDVPKKPKVTSQGDPEFQGITDKLLGKQKPITETLAKGEKYTDEQGRVWDFDAELNKHFQGANLKAVPKITVDEHITFIKSKEPIESMKEANKVIKREGRYKNLTNDESQKILKDTDDHIFQREPKPDEFDPDYASGGRIGYAAGKIVKGGRWFLKSLKDTKKQLIKLDMPLEQKKVLLGQADNAIKDIESGGRIPEQIIQHIRQDPKFRGLKHDTRASDPDLAEMEEVILEYGKRHAEGGRASLMYGGDPGFAFEYGGSWADWHDHHRNPMPVEQYIQT